MKDIRVLIVDDVSSVREDLHTVLTLAGGADKDHAEDEKNPIEIIGEAANGLEAVSMAEALQPDVVLMDLEMPVLDGYEATRQIKAHCPACRVIALTVHEDAAARKQAFQAGMDAFIVKGAPLETLVQAISGLERKE